MGAVRADTDQAEMNNHMADDSSDDASLPQ